MRRVAKGSPLAACVLIGSCSFVHVRAGGSNTSSVRERTPEVKIAYVWKRTRDGFIS